jgi:Ca2+-binding RTX toxin-like protein
MRHPFIALLTAAAVTALSSAAAQASTITAVHYEPLPCTNGDECRYYMPEPAYDNFTLSGSPGEANKMTVSGSSNGVSAGTLRFRDDGAPIGDIPARCTRIDANEVTCFGNLGFANGGDGNDVISTNGTSVFGLGGPGDDELIGSDLPDRLNGGPGNDVLRGNGGYDTLEDGEPGAAGDADQFVGGPDAARVSYVSSKAAVTVDLANMTDPVQGEPGEGDRLSDVNAVDGGMGNDELSAADTGSKLTGGAGDDKLTGRAGNDELDGGYGKNVIDAGAGNDAIGPDIAVPSENRVVCGEGADVVQTPSKKDLIGGDCDQIIYYADLDVRSFLPLTTLSGPVARATDLNCFSAGRPNMELRVARLYRTAGMPKAGTLLGRKTGTRRTCRPGRSLTVRLSPAGQRLLRRHKALPVEVRVNDPGNRERYITQLVAP